MPKKGQGDAGAQGTVHPQPGQQRSGHQQLADDLLPGPQTQITLFYHLDEIVQKADQAKAEGGEDGQIQAPGIRAAHQLGAAVQQAGEGQADREYGAQNEAQTAHGGGTLLFVVPGGANLLDGLPEVQLM